MQQEPEGQPEAKRIDPLSPEQRARCMSRIKGKDTKPELQVRKALFALGYRYRLHNGQLPGKPDIILPRYRAVIFVNGCFWHGHRCHLFKWPRTRSDFWLEKIHRNRENDERAENSLLSADWRILRVWECALRGRTRLPLEQVINQIHVWLHGTSSTMEIKGV